MDTILKKKLAFALIQLAAGIALLVGDSLGWFSATVFPFVIISSGLYQTVRFYDLLKERKQKGTDRFIKDQARQLTYAGLLFSAGRKAGAGKAEIEKLQQLMEERFGSAPLYPMVARGIEEADGLEGRKSLFEDLRLFSRSFGADTVQELLQLFQGFAHDPVLRSPMTEQAYSELEAVLESARA
ncbi:hypothetical protein [Kordiimonas marina]|uniref:hypothetical protein n=1 Tax=Kordiimonas marina TaxID=2872312 RepID=UPI001FF49CF3|nr:hypothetical protein [Kordiimonas marina]MCJ9428098.1 hypothetical protein [Kordiimonas marina]